MERTKIIKAGLAKIYGYKNVSVTGGRGTACGWVHIRVRVNHDVHDHRGYGDKCLEIEKKAVEALAEHGLTPYTFLADDGYNTEDNAMLVSLESI